MFIVKTCWKKTKVKIGPINYINYSLLMFPFIVNYIKRLRTIDESENFVASGNGLSEIHYRCALPALNWCTITMHLKDWIPTFKTDVLFQFVLKISLNVYQCRDTKNNEFKHGEKNDIKLSLNLKRCLFCLMLTKKA